jgi:hypothetical protein
MMTEFYNIGLTAMLGGQTVCLTWLSAGEDFIEL